MAYTYDNDGNVTAETDGAGHTWTTSGYVETAGGDAAATQTDPSGMATTTSYNADGDQATVTNNAGNVATYAYDPADQNTGISYSDGTTPAVTYTYLPNGQVHTMHDGTGTTTYTYNTRDKVSSVTNGLGYTLSYGYDDAANVTSITYPGGNTVTRAFDDQNRLASVTDWNSKTTSFAYDGEGNLVTTTYPNSTVAADTYDSANRLDKIDVTKSGSTIMTFDSSASGAVYPNDQTKNLATSSTSGYNLKPATDGYAYDPLGELIGDTETGTGSQTTSETFTAAGWINTMTTSGTSTYNYASDGELTSITGSGPTTFAYDANGNRACERASTSTCTSSPTQTFGYDEENRMTSWTKPSSSKSETLAYDGNSNLADEFSTKPGTACDPSPCTTTKYTAYTWDSSGGSPVLAATWSSVDGVAAGETDYIDGPDGLPVEQITPDGVPEWYYHDPEGSTRALLDSSGNVTTTFNYSLWGTVSTAASPAETTPLQFDEELHDDLSGLLGSDGSVFDPGTASLVAASGGAGGGGYQSTIDPVNDASTGPPDCWFQKGSKVIWHWCQPASSVWKNKKGNYKRSQAWVASLDTNHGSGPHFNLRVERAGTRGLKGASGMCNFHIYYCGIAKWPVEPDPNGGSGFDRYKWAVGESVHDRPIPPAYLGPATDSPPTLEQADAAARNMIPAITAYVGTYYRHFDRGDFASTLENGPGATLGSDLYALAKTKPTTSMTVAPCNH